ncbi:MAG: hypothetical protein A2Y78_00140 [Acidobacteria bacterium RBG_13_68_16]|nr:MAG: hypothetical protein A2Y78_00140 [Acidobacteria bacterium RBG_13_68_16]
MIRFAPILLLALILTGCSSDDGVPGYLVDWLVVLLAPVATAAVALAGRAVQRYVETLTRSAMVRETLIRASTVAGLAALEVASVFTAAIKTASEDGSLTPAEGRQALNLALAKAREYLGPKGLAALDEILGRGGDQAVDRYLIALIEAALAAEKGQLK